MRFRAKHPLEALLRNTGFSNYRHEKFEANNMDSIPGQPWFAYHHVVPNLDSLNSKKIEGYKRKEVISTTELLFKRNFFREYELPETHRYVQWLRRICSVEQKQNNTYGVGILVSHDGQNNLRAFLRVPFYIMFREGVNFLELTQKETVELLKELAAGTAYRVESQANQIIVKKTTEPRTAGVPKIGTKTLPSIPGQLTSEDTPPKPADEGKHSTDE